MIRSWQLTLVRIWVKYRGYLQVTFLIVALTGYCLVLGKYALDNFEKVTLHNRNASLHRKQAFRYARQMMAPAPPPPTPLDLPAVEAEMARRRDLVSRTCAKYQLGESGRPNAWEFFIDTKHKLVWCNVFKAASSTWMYNFNLLGGYKEYYLKHSNKTPLVLARAHFPRPTVDRLRASLTDSLSFLIVREPFERLLSAYRNKIESLRHRYYRKVAREMMARHPPIPKGTAPPAGPTFPQFVDYVVDTAGRGRRFDEHWAPFHSFCTPCHVNFTVVAKLETLDRDQAYVVTRAGLGPVLGTRAYRRGREAVMNRARDGRTTRSLVAKYYVQLSAEQLDRLYKIYALDFEMFGYDPAKYFAMVKRS